MSSPDPPLDRILGVVASVDAAPPTEDWVVATLDALAETEGRPASVEQSLAHVFGHLGFAGDTATYYDPANSLVHRVIERRRGIPITLAAVAAEIARRHGHVLSLVGLPGHVLLGDGPAPGRWFDPFGGGRALDLDGCRALFGRIYPIEAFQPAMVAPMTTDAVVTRMLLNLWVAFAGRRRLAETVPVLELRVGMASSGVQDRAQLATTLAALGRYDRAAEERDRLAELDPANADHHRALARAHRAHRN